jgi:hypothetical protein
LPRAAGARSITVRSVHDIEWKLFAEDNQRIRETQQQLVAFKKVAPKEYLTLVNTPLEPQQARKPGKATAR